MYQNIETQTNTRHSVVRSKFEISQFMKNFAQALTEGNPEEISTYFADDVEEAEIPPIVSVREDDENANGNQNPLILNENITANDRFGIFTGLVCLRGVESKDAQENGGWHLLTCVLDKSEGYWEILQIRNKALI